MAAAFEGQIADAIIAAAELNKTVIIDAINSVEGGVEAFLANAVNNVKPNGAILPLIWNAVKPSIVSELAKVEAANPGTVIFALIDAEVHTLAKSIGG